MRSISIHKTVILGCDDFTKLAEITQNIAGTILANYSLITVSRSSDLITTIRQSNPDLVILAFRHNQNVMDNLIHFTREDDLSIFCFTSRYETMGITWQSNHMVFTYPYTLAKTEGTICQRLLTVCRFFNANGVKEKTNGYNLEKNLSRYVLELEQKKELNERMKNRLKELYPLVDENVRAELQSLVNSLKNLNGDKKYWEDFKHYFERINPQFIDFLSQRHPSLTAKDLKYCCYLKMNMSNNDITQLLGINQESVRTHKYRLKKKMALSKKENLENYLKAFSPHQVE